MDNNLNKTDKNEFEHIYPYNNGVWSYKTFTWKESLNSDGEQFKTNNHLSPLIIVHWKKDINTIIIMKNWGRIVWDQTGLGPERLEIPLSYWWRLYFSSSSFCMYLSCVLSNIFYLPCWLSVDNMHPFVLALVVLTSFVLCSFMTMLSSIFVRKKLIFF